MDWIDLRLRQSRTASGDLVVRLGEPVLDRYLEFLGTRSRPNTVLAAAYDLRVFFRAGDCPTNGVNGLGGPSWWLRERYGLRR